MTRRSPAGTPKSRLLFGGAEQCAIGGDIASTRGLTSCQDRVRRSQLERAQVCWPLTQRHDVKTLGSFYDFVPDGSSECDLCGWKGANRDLAPSILSRTNVATYDCPNCAATLLSTPIPSFADVRIAAAAGNPHAQADLQEAEAQEREQTAMKATELSAAHDLPDLGLTAPTVFIWDQECDEDRRQWTIIRTAEVGRLVWRERTYWEGHRRFGSIRSLLIERYGSAFVELVASSRALLWLGGDVPGALTEIGYPRLATGREAPWIRTTER